jgi:hypothetical protein
VVNFLQAQLEIVAERNDGRVNFNSLRAYVYSSAQAGQETASHISDLTRLNEYMHEHWIEKAGYFYAP